MARGQKLFAGSRVGQLKLLMRVRVNPKDSYALRKKWRVECDCGARLTVPEMYLLREHPKKHCGAPHHTATFNSLHKDVRGIWQMMRTRCYDPKHIGYPYYGGRGVKVCERWLNDPDGFENFVKDVGSRPSKNHTLDRLNPNGWYCKHNFRWATWSQQNLNKRFHKPESANEPVSRCEGCPHAQSCTTSQEVIPAVNDA